jgi:hypothetical protein
MLVSGARLRTSTLHHPAQFVAFQASPSFHFFHHELPYQYPTPAFPTAGLLIGPLMRSRWDLPSPSAQLFLTSHRR